MTTRRKSRAILGFGFDPTQSPHHFTLARDSATGLVTIAEHFDWGEDAAADDPPAPSRKAVLDDYRWSRLATAVAETFNSRLRASRLPTGTWTMATDLAPHLGKELTLLFWAVEDADPTLLPAMLANWMGLAPEERWWLYSTINATSGHPEHGRDRGWRKAIKIAFAENPVATTVPTVLLAEPTPYQKKRASRKRPKDALPQSEDAGQLSLFA